MIGDEFDGYRVEAPLGEGGMAMVYRAQHLRLNRPVALKVLRRELVLEPGQVARFHREYKVLATLSNSHIIRVFDFGEHREMHYYTMELLSAPTLDCVMRKAGYPEQRLPLDRCVTIAAEMLDGLAACHALQLVHRDLKPSNVFVHADRGAVIADFGLVMSMQSTRLTATGETVGTISYMSPEQTMGNDITPQSDLYAVGVILFELLTGRPPFTDATVIGLLQAHALRQPPRLSERNPAVPPALDALMARVLAKSPADRPADALAMGAQLLDCVSTPARPAVPRRPTAKRALVPVPRPRSWRWAGAALAAAALVVVLALSAVRPRGDFEPRQVQIKPQLHRALLTFDTMDATAPMVEWWSRAAAPSTTSSTEVARHHELELKGLEEGTDYQLRILAPGNERSRTWTFRTERVTAEGLAIVRGVDTAELTFRTEVPVRVFATYWPSDAPGDAAKRQTQRVEGPPTTAHRVVVTQLAPERAYAVRLGFLTDDLEDARSADFMVPSTVTILSEVVQRVSQFDTPRVVAAMQSLLTNAGKNLNREAELRYLLAPHFSTLAGIAKTFRPLAKGFFDSPAVYIREKMRVYDVLALASHMDRLCLQHHVSLRTGLADVDRGSLGLEQVERLQAPEVIPLAFPEPRIFMNLDSTVGDASLFGHRQRADLTFPVTDLSSVVRAELYFQLVDLNPEQYFEARINDAANLVIAGATVNGPGRLPQKLYHHLDRALLVEGTNRLGLSLRSVPGLICAETPFVERVALHLERRR